MARPASSPPSFLQGSLQISPGCSQRGPSIRRRVLPATTATAAKIKTRHPRRLLRRAAAWPVARLALLEFRWLPVARQALRQSRRATCSLSKVAGRFAFALRLGRHESKNSCAVCLRAPARDSLRSRTRISSTKPTAPDSTNRNVCTFPSVHFVAESARPRHLCPHPDRPVSDCVSHLPCPPPPAQC